MGASADCADAPYQCWWSLKFPTMGVQRLLCFLCLQAKLELSGHQQQEVMQLHEAFMAAACMEVHPHKSGAAYLEFLGAVLQQVLSPLQFARASVHWYPAPPDALMIANITALHNHQHLHHQQQNQRQQLDGGGRAADLMLHDWSPQFGRVEEPLNMQLMEAAAQQMQQMQGGGGFWHERVAMLSGRGI